MTVHVDPSSNLHPYECDGPGHCIHCDRAETEMHNPTDCVLCASDEYVRVLDPEEVEPAEAQTQIIGKPKELAEVASVSRVEIAHKAHAEAVRRIMELGAQLSAAFEALAKAQNLMHESGVEAMTKFPKPIDSAWAAWKNEKR
jgi:hypothetical protein